MALESHPLQRDMFTGQLVDARSAYHKQRDRERDRLQQPLLFPIQEVFQFGVQARPWLNNLPAPPLILTQEDSRTPEEQEVDLLREAQSLTVPLFATTTPSLSKEQPDERELLPDEAFLHILLQTSDLLTTDDPGRYVWRLLTIWRILLNPASGSLTFGMAALRYWCAWLIHQFEPKSLLPTYPVLSVSKTDLMVAYPELAITIASLKATEMQHLVQQIEVALQPFYPAALKVALDRYFERCPF